MRRIRKHITVRIKRDIYRNGQRYYMYIYSDGTDRLYLAKGKNQVVPEDQKKCIKREITVSDLPANMPKLNNLEDSVLFAKIFGYVDY
jgi:hypothetical protein